MSSSLLIPLPPRHQPKLQSAGGQSAGCDTKDSTGRIPAHRPPAEGASGTNEYRLIGLPLRELPQQRGLRPALGHWALGCDRADTSSPGLTLGPSSPIYPKHLQPHSPSKTAALSPRTDMRSDAGQLTAGHRLDGRPRLSLMTSARTFSLKILFL